jgi:hypothetical protein
MNDYTNTLAALTKRFEHHSHELRLIQTARAILWQHKEAPLTFEVYIQQNGPGRMPIRVDRQNLAEATQEADRLWAAHNPTTVGHPQYELFVRVGDVRIAVDPADLVDLGFTLEGRIADFPKKMVFGPGEELPAWYTGKPTPEPEVAPV